ncbi:MAG: hypothetical protein ABI082_09350 [Dokdonella sp.]
MINNLLPRQADNRFQGQKLGLWILSAVLLLFAAMSANSIFNGYFVASEVDGIPLATYTADGAQAVVSIYAIWGVAQLTVVTFGIFVLVRYRALASLAFLVLLIEQILWRIVNHALPIAKSGPSSGAWFVYALFAITLLGFALSLWKRKSNAESLIPADVGRRAA